MRKAKLKDLFDYLPKSKVKAGDGLEEGMYPFYTSSENQTKYLNEYQHGPGCLVFGTGGKASVHFTTCHFSTSTDCIAIKSKQEIEIDAGYVFQYFKGNMQVLENGFKGAGLKHISKAYLSDIEIPYPEDIDDQRCIAHLLGKVEGMIAQRKQHLQQLDDLLKSVFLEMFGDLEINTPLSSECSFSQGIQIPIEEQFPEMSDGRIRFLRIVDYTQSDEPRYIATPGDRYCVESDDIAMVRYGASAGFAGFGKKGAIANNLFKFNFDKNRLAPMYLYYCLKTERFGAFIRKKAFGAAMPALSFGIMNDYSIAVPPYELQNQFAAIVEKVEGIKSRYQQSLTDLEALYGTLSQQAFKGELDLSRVPLPGTQPEEEAVAVEPLHTPAEQVLAINLPDTDNLLAALESAEARVALITQWLESYRGQLGSMPFSVQQFMEAAQTRLTELHPDNDFELGVTDYEHIKAWVFNALAAGTLTQAFDDAGNRIELKVVQV